VVAVDQRRDLLSVKPTAPEQRFGDDRNVILAARNEPLCHRPNLLQAQAGDHNGLRRERSSE
jgi:hypothetical protein